MNSNGSYEGADKGKHDHADNRGDTTRPPQGIFDIGNVAANDRDARDVNELLLATILRNIERIIYRRTYLITHNRSQTRFTFFQKSSLCVDQCLMGYRGSVC